MTSVFIKGNYFLFDLSKLGLFDGIITDVPYKDSLQEQLGEEYFDPLLFMQKAFDETKPDAFLITFINFFGISRMVNAARAAHWNFVAFQIWNKNKTSPISLNAPRRHCEYVIFLTKGNYKFPDFNDVFLTFYGDPSTKIRVAEKPEEFSEWFKSIVGDAFILDPFCGSGNLVNDFTMAVCIDVLDYPSLKRDVSKEYLKYKESHKGEKDWRKTWKDQRLSMIAEFEAREPNPFEQQEKIKGTKSTVKTLKEETKKRRSVNKSIRKIHKR